MMKTERLCCVLALMACVSGMAHAQSTAASHVEIAGSRPQPDYDPQGIRVRGLLIGTELTTSTAYDNNVYGEPDHATEDGFVSLAPAITVDSDWERSAINLSASGLFTRYFSLPKQNTDEYNLGAKGRLDIGRTQITGTLSAMRSAERRGSSGTPLTLGEPSIYNSFQQSVQAQQSFGSFVLSVTGGHSRTSYSTLALPDGSRESQAFRNSESWSGGGRIGYAPSSLLSLFVSGQYQHNQSPGLVSCSPNDPAAAAACSRASTTLTFLGGGVADHGLLRLDASGGYMQQHFTNPIFRNYSGPVYNLSLTWAPTPLMTWTLQSRRSLENSGVPEDGYILARADTVQLAYELLRNLVFRLKLSDRRDHFRESHGHSTLKSQELKVEYKFNRTVAITPYETYECRSSSDRTIDRRYCAIVAGLSVSLKR